ncbi:RimJ/RimL family protein N-acetyltransferase [Litorivivens lipolytica]|uniref:RimJ/RimL family protein N-acetyltransferase n=1 Tax=Litorivivens lipolytica TaxID=1524264 RepID=A0A7W4W3R7_9GAMM|nr:GNAT family N-acetyltransferase [Litorivivens lipolytica]MBB3046785.1 RimJ/RimL family protein N-acetyltransferase [Litorivivens lipolytica]
MITLRAFRSDDEKQLVSLANNPRVTRFLRDQFPRPYTRRDAQYWIDEGSSSREGQHFCISLHGECIGSIGVFWGKREYRYSGEVGYWLGEPFWGMGYASEALSQFTDWLEQDSLLERFYAMVVPENVSSCRVLEKCGYECEGRARRSIYRDGQWQDELIYAKLRAAERRKPMD